jgi:uncharacterized protein (TIGR00661 family)
LINGKNSYTPLSRPSVLISPLDWGLGHATRCIPIISHLLSLDCTVYIAASGNGYILLKKEFPSAVILRINSYKIRYSRKKIWLPVILFFQLPGIIFSIFKEKLWLQSIIKKYRIHAVISDNRFGLYNAKIPSVYITHQLYIKTGNKFSDYAANRFHNFFIKKYSFCWVPDVEKDGLAGELSHPQKIPSHVLYIGPLSRFEKIPEIHKKYDIVISISGPEPQRTIFEKIVLAQIKETTHQILLVRGLPGEKKRISANNNNVHCINHLPAVELNLAFQQAEIIISRCGYTTVMDLAKLGKKAVLVPTPGQTEQEYLATYLMNKKLFYAVDQDKFSLESALSAFTSKDFTCKPVYMEMYKKIIFEFVQSLKSGNFTSQ